MTPKRIKIIGHCFVADLRTSCDKDKASGVRLDDGRLHDDGDDRPRTLSSHPPGARQAGGGHDRWDVYVGCISFWHPAVNNGELTDEIFMAETTYNAHSSIALQSHHLA